MPVAIVGGGVVGLSAAVFLAAQGVDTLLVERHPDLLSHPRARGFTPRTVELYRQVGLEPAIRAALFASGEELAFVPVRAETVASEVHHPVEEPAEPLDERLSPCAFAPIDQDKLEAILRQRARELGADIRYSTELTGFTQDADGVSLRLLDRRSGESSTVRAGHLIAADGHKSPVRHALGIPVEGPGPFFDVVTLMVEADLRPALRGRRFGIAYLNRPRPGTIMLAHDRDGRRWVFGTGFDPRQGDTLEAFAGDRGVEMVRAAAGLPGVPVTIRPQIPGTDLKALAWAVGAQVATSFREGRVFLAGDAAHIVPPTGGLGANTGIQDAHNLAWKLAMVVRGEAGPDLLATYDAERRPVALMTMQQTLALWSARMGVGDPGAAPQPILDYGSVVYGYRYRSGAGRGADDAPAPVVPVDALAGQPGTRAPHVWLRRDGEPVSTIDLFGRGFVLLAGAAGAVWVEAARSLSGVALAAYRVGGNGDLADPAGGWSAAYGTTGDGAVLVRPDGVVAWRTERPSGEPARVLAAALSEALARRSAAAPAA